MPKFGDIGSNFHSGAKCFFERTGGAASENCSDVWWVIALLGVTTVVQITSSFYVAKEDSGAYSIVLQSAAPFLADLVFGSKTIMGQYEENVSTWIWLSLVLTVIGCGIYRWGSTDPLEKVNRDPTWFHKFVLGNPDASSKLKPLAEDDYLKSEESSVNSPVKENPSEDDENPLLSV
jgi:hypothetical protein